MINVNSEMFEEVLRGYWRYYNALEKQMLITSQYVEFSEYNYKTYSLEFLKLYQSVCSEIDVFGKALANLINPEFDVEDEKININKWWYEVQNWYLSLELKTVVFCKAFSLSPWDNYITEWTTNSRGSRYCRLLQRPEIHIPIWWKSYNEVKHRRRVLGQDGDDNYKKANLQNLCNAFAALYILEKNCLLNLGDEVAIQKIPRSDLFERKDMIFLTDKKGNIMGTYNENIDIPEHGFDFDKFSV